MALSHKPWDQLTDEEKQEWEESAEKNSARFAGNARLSAQGFHQHVTTLTARQKAAKERSKLRY